MFFVRSFIVGSIATVAAMAISYPGWALPLSPGDRLRLFVAGEENLPENERFTATYEVNLDGTLQFPFLPPIQSAGREVSQVEQELRRALIQRGFFKPDFLQLSLQIFEWAPVQVSVAGAVFYPGRVLINNDEQSKGRDLPAAIATVSGDYPPQRYLTAAILSAGGVKPNANLREVRLIRGNQERLFDLSGEFTGAPVEDVPLIAGDQIIVPELDRYQNELVRLSQVTPQTIRVYMSNLTTPNNAGNIDAQELPYGSRFSQAAVAADCIGGTRSTNAKRRAVLIQTDRISGETKVLERRVEELIRNPSDQVGNPYLMPEDSVVCYDSTITNVASIFRTIGDIVNPLDGLRSLIRNLFGSQDDD